MVHNTPNVHKCRYFLTRWCKNSPEEVQTDRQTTDFIFSIADMEGKKKIKHNAPPYSFCNLCGVLAQSLLFHHLEAAVTIRPDHNHILRSIALVGFQTRGKP